jgi:hypothetical protein
VLRQLASLYVQVVKNDPRMERFTNLGSLNSFNAFYQKLLLQFRIMKVELHTYFAS